MRIGEYLPHATIAVESKPIAAATKPQIPWADAAELSEDLRFEMGILAGLGVGKPALEKAAQSATVNRTSIERELLANGLVQECAYYGAIARALRLPCVDSIADGAVADGSKLDSQLLKPTMLRLTHSRRAPLTAIAPEARRIDEIRKSIIRYPDLRHSLAVAAPSTIRAAVWRAGAARRVRDTVTALFETRPRFSARVVFYGNQGFYAGITVSVIAAGLMVSDAGQLLLHVFLSTLYLTALWLRAIAVIQRRHKRLLPALHSDVPLPVYTVMVALYQEAGLAEQLVAALKRIDWPASLLDIKLVCEADDQETILALREHCLGPQFEIVEVPPMQPRTKPKALTYALAGARGAYLVVYDAEDRPHPQQLREAHARFASAAADVACLQAPLVIANSRESWISALFSLEYSALFRGLLPMLATHRMPLPLGGTSNHFRTDILRAVGAWDPFNVTEDADLGMRLYRLGYRSEVILRQTLEDAPTSIGIWTRQRTRWFKGWLQTWLVLMRDPGGLRREMGGKAFAVFHLLIGGMLISSLAHPLMVVFLVRSSIAMFATPGSQPLIGEMVLLTVDFVNIIGSYATFIILGHASMTKHEQKQIGWRWMAVPLYWMMVSLAAWRAVFELRSNPFFWHKTPHTPSSRIGK
ncbi:glycosyltransferase family 2 protein [Rhizobium tubonense]|uniref:Glycosyl transferase n=1 Tax=Rhizobium tubonense TaxID=484088 RepID=A0A2W4CH29_9HYPH|nr:glycosyltransferase family 2 protein [Rhizobium tubonense]PZM12071.1 glycosyl transferase [Rhizobium tubonense]